MKKELVIALDVKGQLLKCFHFSYLKPALCL